MIERLRANEGFMAATRLRRGTPDGKRQAARWALLPVRNASTAPGTLVSLLLPP